MALMRRQLISMMADQYGQTRKQFLFTADNSVAVLTAEQPLLDAMQAISVGVVRAALIQEVKYYVGTAGNGPYSTIRDCAQFLFSSLAGRQVWVTVNAPDESIFIPDTVDVDLTNPLVIDLVTEALAILCDDQGSPLESLIRAERGIVP